MKFPYAEKLEGAHFSLRSEQADRRLGMPMSTAVIGRSYLRESATTSSVPLQSR
jgi:hypothetical protein